MSAADGIVETDNWQAWTGGVHAGTAVRANELRQQEIAANSQDAAARTAASQQHWQDMADAAAARTKLGYDKLSASQSQRDQAKMSLITNAANDGLDMVRRLDDGTPDPDSLDELAGMDLSSLNLKYRQSHENKLREQYKQAHEQETLRATAQQVEQMNTLIDAQPFMTPQQKSDAKEQVALNLKDARHGVLHEIAQQRQSARIAGAAIGPDGQPLNDQQSALMRSLPPTQAAAMARQAAAPPKPTGGKSGEAKASENAEKLARSQLAEWWNKHAMAKFTGVSGLTTQEREELQALEDGITAASRKTQAALRGPAQPSPAAPAPGAVPPPKDAIDAAIDAAIAAERGQQ